MLPGRRDTIQRKTFKDKIGSNSQVYFRHLQQDPNKCLSRIHKVTASHSARIYTLLMYVSDFWGSKSVEKSTMTSVMERSICKYIKVHSYKNTGNKYSELWTHTKGLTSWLRSAIYFWTLTLSRMGVISTFFVWFLVYQNHNLPMIFRNRILHTAYSQLTVM